MTELDGRRCGGCAAEVVRPARESGDLIATRYLRITPERTLVGKCDGCGEEFRIGRLEAERRVRRLVLPAERRPRPTPPSDEPPPT